MMNSITTTRSPFHPPYKGNNPPTMHDNDDNDKNSDDDDDGDGDDDDDDDGDDHQSPQHPPTAPQPPKQPEGTRVILIITNLIATCNVGMEVHLPFLAEFLPNIEYSPATHPARRHVAMYRDKQTGVTCEIFASGKLKLHGGTNEYNTRITSRRVARLIQRFGHPSATYNNFRVYDVTCQYDFGHMINLSTLESLTGGEPVLKKHKSKLPAVTWTTGPADQRCTAFIYENGNVILKARAYEIVYGAVWVLHGLLMQSKM